MCKKMLARKLKMYHDYHSKCWTQLTHYIGVPLVIFGLLTITSWVHIRVPTVFDMPLPWLLSIAALVYYMLLDTAFAAVLAVFFIIFNVIISLAIKNQPSWLSFKVFLITFILGWILQFIGHVIEKKKPAFLDDLKQILTAPLFLVAEIFFYFGQKQGLKKAMEDVV